MIQFCNSHAGRGVASVCLALVFILWPATVGWPAAAVTAAYGVRHLFEACRSAAEEETAADKAA